MDIIFTKIFIFTVINEKNIDLTCLSKYLDFHIYSNKWENYTENHIWFLHDRTNLVFWIHGIPRCISTAKPCKQYNNKCYSKREVIATIKNCLLFKKSEFTSLIRLCSANGKTWDPWFHNMLVILYDCKDW